MKARKNNLCKTKVLVKTLYLAEILSMLHSSYQKLKSNAAKNLQRVGKPNLKHKTLEKPRECLYSLNALNIIQKKQQHFQIKI